MEQTISKQLLPDKNIHQKFCHGKKSDHVLAELRHPTAITTALHCTSDTLRTGVLSGRAEDHSAAVLSALGAMTGAPRKMSSSQKLKSQIICDVAVPINRETIRT